MTTRWLTPEEQRAWRAYVGGALLLEDALDRQLQQEAGMPHLYYSILAHLSEAEDRRLRMTDLAGRLKITRSRLTYAVTRLERDGLVRREDCPGDRRGSIAALTDAGMALLERIAPSHVETVRAALFDRLTPEQVGQLEEIFTVVTRGLEGAGPGGGDAGQGTGGGTGGDLPWLRRSSPCS